jgi:hypothetical protein
VLDRQKFEILLQAIWMANWFCLLAAVPTAVFAPGLALMSVHRRPTQPELPLQGMVGTYGRPAGGRPRMVVVNGFGAQLMYWLASRNRSANINTKNDEKASPNVVGFEKKVTS